MSEQARKYRPQVLPYEAAASIGAAQAEYVLAGRFKGMLYIVAALIVYGSLYPFNFYFDNISFGGVSDFLSDTNTISRSGDILGNIGLFVPFGVAGMLGLVPGRSAAARLLLLCLIGFFLAAGLQALQLFLPTRHAALGDVAWNLVGGALGALLVWPAGVRARLLAQAGMDVPLFPLFLLGCWVAGELAPFVPSIDLQAFKDGAKPLFAAPEIASLAFLRTYVSWLVLCHFASGLWPRHASTLWLAGAAAATIAAKILVVQNAVSSGYVLAVVLALLTWQLFLRRSSGRIAILLLGVGLLVVVASLEPFHLRGTAQSFSWVPFSGALSGSMLTNVKAVASKIFLLGSLLCLMQAAGFRTAVATALVVLLAAVLEVGQIWIGQHTPEITDPLLALFLAMLMVVFRQEAVELPRRRIAPATAQAGSPAAGRSSPSSGQPAPLSDHAASAADRLIPKRGAVIVALAACVVATLIMRTVLGLPQIPYNVRELFGGEEAWWRLFLFALAGLSIGLGGALVGRIAARHDRAYLILPAGTVAACLVVYLLLVASVSAESLRDITGSSNTYWFVMNRHIWGDFGVWFYEAIGSRALIQAVEQFVRFTALFGQGLLWIAILSTVYFRLAGLPAGDFRTRAAVALATGFFCLLAAAPWLILFNLVAFDFSSTDNLNELLDGHGHVSYLLLILLPLSALLVVHAVRRPRPARVFCIALVVVVSLPVGWLLLKNGLSPVVTKYGKVFSGADFLLGPDRQDLLPTSVLMARWFVVQGAAIGALALGMNLVPAPLESRR